MPLQVTALRARVAATLGSSGLGRLTKDTLIYGLGGSLSRMIGILLAPVFTRIFRPPDYGALDLLTTVVSFLTLFSIAGLNSAVFYMYRRSDAPCPPRQIVGTAMLVSTGFASVLALAGLALTATVTDVLLRDPAYQLAVALNFLWLPVNVVSSMALDLLRLEFRPVAYSLIGLGRTLVAAALGVVLVLGFHMGIAGMLAAQIVLGLVGLAAALWLMRGRWSLRLRPIAARAMLRYGIPFVPTGLAYWVLSFSDRYFVLQFLSLGDVGIYGIANRLASIVQLFIFAFQTAWWPFAYAQADQPGHQALYARVLRLSVAALSVVGVGIGLFAHEAVLVIAPPVYAPAYAFAGMLAYALVVNGAYQVISIAVALAQRTIHLAWTSGVAAVVNLLLNLTLIPTIGLFGASLSTLVAYLVSTVLLFVMAQRAYPIPYQLGAVAKVGLASAVTLAAGLVLDGMGPPERWLPGVTLAKLGVLAIYLLVVAGAAGVPLRNLLGMLAPRRGRGVV